MVRGDPAEFHAREFPNPMTAQLWWFEPDRPALILGSTQSDALVDRQECDSRGIEVVRRRSGGGVVLVVPGEVAWFDVLVPRDHPRFDDDISRGAWWVGEVLRDALGRPDAEVHTGPVVHTPWSSLVCFAGLGPGELHVGHRKLSGLSQRRTRAGVRVQCAVYRRWDPEMLSVLLRPPRPRPAELVDLVTTAVLDLAALVSALGQCR